MMGCVSISDLIEDWHLKTDRLERRGQKIVGWNLQVQNERKATSQKTEKWKKRQKCAYVQMTNNVPGR